MFCNFDSFIIYLFGVSCTRQQFTEDFQKLNDCYKKAIMVYCRILILTNCIIFCQGISCTWQQVIVTMYRRLTLGTITAHVTSGNCCVEKWLKTILVLIMAVSGQTSSEWACIIYLFTFMCLQINSQFLQLLTVPLGKVSNQMGTKTMNCCSFFIRSLYRHLHSVTIELFAKKKESLIFA